MNPLEWLAARFQRRMPPAPLTPPSEHAAAEQRVKELKRGADRLERLAEEYRRMERDLG